MVLCYDSPTKLTQGLNHTQGVTLEHAALYSSLWALLFAYNQDLYLLWLFSPEFFLPSEFYAWGICCYFFFLNLLNFFFIIKVSSLSLFPQFPQVRGFFVCLFWLHTYRKMQRSQVYSL